jgi:hypothetical protein
MQEIFFKKFDSGFRIHYEWDGGGFLYFPPFKLLAALFWKLVNARHPESSPETHLRLGSVSLTIAFGQPSE